VGGAYAKAPIELDVQERLQARGEVDLSEQVISTEHDPGCRAVSWCNDRDDRSVSPVQIRANPKRRAKRAVVKEPLHPSNRSSINVLHHAGLSSDQPHCWLVAGEARADYLKGTVTGLRVLENTAMKSRSSGVR